MLHDELQYFINHQDELLRQYQGKVLVIKNQHVIGVYDDMLEAYLTTAKEHEVGTFLIQECQPGEEAYTVTVSSIQMQPEHA